MKIYQNAFNENPSLNNKELLYEADSVEALKAKGKEIAQTRGELEATWFSEPVMGEKRLDTASKWYMSFSDETVLTISE